jgi:hypothetical protein
MVRESDVAWDALMEDWDNGPILGCAQVFAPRRGQLAAVSRLASHRAQSCRRAGPKPGETQRIALHREPGVSVDLSSHGSPLPATVTSRRTVNPHEQVDPPPPHVGSLFGRSSRTHGSLAGSLRHLAEVRWPAEGALPSICPVE